jgi:MarR family transcriptional regulator, organic hydroperoxide resistance regulator
MGKFVTEAFDSIDQGPAQLDPGAGPSGTDLLKLDHQLCFALYAASRAITRTYRDQLEPHGLTYPQYLVLTVLWEENNLSLTSIGRRLRLDSGTLTPLVKRLESGGLVTRDRRITDEREIEISLTAQGLAMKDHAVHVRQAVVQRLSMSEQDIKHLRSELISLVENLDAQEEQARKSSRQAVRA